MKLYDPSLADSYVWHMLPKNSKHGQPGSYQLTREPSPKMWEERGWILLNPVQIGWYDKEGFYCTYRPGVEGVFDGKYFRTLQGRHLQQAKVAFERQRIEDKWPAKEEVLV